MGSRNLEVWEVEKMNKLDASQIQADLPEILTRVKKQGERIVIEQEGQAIAAIISSADLKRLEALEDAKDAELICLRLAANEEFFTAEEVIAYYNEQHGTNFTVESILNEP